ncbi:MAG: hypothetical protein Q9187_006470, partial [Circinaria calcarea]
MSSSTGIASGMPVSSVGDVHLISSSSAIIVGTPTLTPGGTITFSGSVISYGSFITNIADSAQLHPPTPTTLPILTIGNSRITANSASAYIINSQTLIPGGAVTVSGSEISYGALITSAQPLPVLIFGNSEISANAASAFIVDSQTLTPGGAITVLGSKISYPPNLVSTKLTSTTLPVLTVGESLITANAASAFIVNSQTLTPGGVITVLGSKISYPPNLVLTKPISATFPVLTVGESLITANTASAFIIASQTLTPGGIITISGSEISLASGASLAVINNQTQVLMPETAISGIDTPGTFSRTSAPGIGGYIYSGFGGSSTPAPAAASASASATVNGNLGTEFEGGGGRVRVRGR